MIREIYNLIKTMSFKILGLNHNTASLIIRERLVISNEEIEHALIELKTIKSIKEAVILSTCNRSELYLNTDNRGLKEAKSWLTKFKKLILILKNIFLPCIKRKPLSI